MNKVILMGRLTRDPEIRYSQGENATAVARYSIAVNRKLKREGQPDADFFNCISFGKQAELVNQYFKKGSRICVSGRIQNDNYTNSQGEKVYTTQILVEELDFVDTKAESGKTESVPKPAADNNGFMNISDGTEDELPFN